MERPAHPPPRARRWPSSRHRHRVAVGDHDGVRRRHLIQHRTHGVLRFGEDDDRFRAVLHGFPQILAQFALCCAVRQQRLQEHPVSAVVAMHRTHLFTHAHPVHDGLDVLDHRRQIVSTDVQQFAEVQQVEIMGLRERVGLAGT